METVEIKNSDNGIGFKIDYDKWKAELDNILAEREEARANTEKKYWASLDYRYDEQLTKLYSIRAHSRGRIHRQYALLNYSEWRKLPRAPGLPMREIIYDQFIEANGAIKFKLTIADQAAYIGDIWKEYEKKAE